MMVLVLVAVSCGREEGKEKSAAAKGTGTVEDYYALPDGFFRCKAKTKVGRAERSRAIVRKNVAAGYILARAGTNSLETALFPGEKKEPYVLVNVYGGKGSRCNDIQALVPGPDGSWTAVSDKVFPWEDIAKLFDPFLVYSLPEKGTTIRMLDHVTRETVAELNWTKKKFSFKKGPAKSIGTIN